MIALSTNASPGYRIGAIIQLALAALMAAASFFPRKMSALDVGELRKYLSGAEESTKLTLHDTQVEIIRQGASALHLKSVLLKASIALLGMAAVTLALGVIVGGAHG